MRHVVAFSLMMLLAAGLASAQVVAPINLQAELMTGGEVNLTWDAPPDGLVEDFEDGVADGFGFYDSETTWDLIDGKLHANATSSNWQCAWWQTMDFTEFTVEAEVLVVSGTTSRGIQFRADGPRDDDYNGYNFYILPSSGRYAVWHFVNGSGSGIISWTDSGDIVDGPNTLKVVGSGNSFDLYINDVYQETLVSDDHPEGMVGCVASSSAQVDYEYINCFPTADMTVTDRVTERPRVAEELDEYGRPVADGPYADGPNPIYEAPATDELDEFIEYKIYVNDTFVGTSDDETYTHQLPALGEYDFNVTADYDEGESSYSNTATVSWDAATLILTGVQTVISPAGGDLVYDIDFSVNVGASYNGVGWWTEVLLPNGQTFGPLSQITFNVTPFMQASVPGMVQVIPALAPPGMYTFYGHVGFYPNPVVSDDFDFEKLGAAAEGELNPADWVGTVPSFD